MASNYNFNIFTGELDITEAGAGPGSQLPNYVATFSNPISWGSPSAGVYTLTVPVATHGKGLNPVVQILEQVSSNYELILIKHVINSSGDIIIQVTQSPDLRFNGKIIVSENN